MAASIHKKKKGFFEKLRFELVALEDRLFNRISSKIKIATQPELAEMHDKP
jgi:hypothetical protein